MAFSKPQAAQNASRSQPENHSTRWLREHKEVVAVSYTHLTLPTSDLV